jgi:hypothetical protein
MRNKLGFGAVVGAMVCVIMGLSGCGASAPENMDKRYTQCLEAGGSFWTEDADWGCDMDGITSHGN